MASPSSPKEAPGANDLRSKIMAIMRDTTMTEQEKARKRQELLMGNWAKPAASAPEKEEQEAKKGAKGGLWTCRQCKRRVGTAPNSVPAANNPTLAHGMN